MPMFRFKIRTMPVFFLMIALLLISSVLASCSGKAASDGGSYMAMASMEGMPEEVKSASLTVQEACQFAVENPDTVKQFPL